MAQGFDYSPKKLMACSSRAEQKQSKKEELDDDFVVLDIAALSPLVAAEIDSTANPRLSLQRTLSRKGSQRAGAEKNTAAAAAAELAGGEEEASVHVAGEGVSSTVAHATSHIGKCRKVAGRRASLGVDPRRVLFFFATLSSMGTLILLYFTLSMSKMADHVADAR
ncbi:uncharacterized protein LOC120276908 isoform X1 [Dioscorea cayenensis subsp. rotundata]|uniref:Uncharacterized protein LOC120276908 isoform X1 n=1 Tax=Dioscorea cayennensis subsp. rotundata TaxID=55577 RepID=A0AB40CHU4_DIOCR|nr:uncharacterized protein LOC120276908 isoform X1 [Dioscorea cayenensis subsp. rotundata]